MTDSDVPERNDGERDEHDTDHDGVRDGPGTDDADERDGPGTDDADERDGHGTDHADENDPRHGIGEDDDADGELPDRLAEEARRLTRLARRATVEDEAEAYREDRDERLADNGFTSRIRSEDDTLVLYPEEWVEDGTVQFERIEDTDRAHELTLSGPGDPDEWDEIEAHNAELVDAVGEAHGEVHRRNARAFADFMGNHYARRVETATREEIGEFVTDYYPRNTWHDEDARDVVRESVRYLFDAADAPDPI
jgi:hypothetical protein